MQPIDTTTLLYLAASAAAGWLLRHWGILAPASAPSAAPQGVASQPAQAPAPVPSPAAPAVPAAAPVTTPAVPTSGPQLFTGALWEKLKADAEGALATALQTAFANAVSTIQPVRKPAAAHESSVAPPPSAPSGAANVSGS